MNKNNLKDKPIKNTSNLDNNNGGFLLGIISAVLLIVCVSVLLLFDNKQVQRIITEKINVDAVNKSSDIESLISNNNSAIEGEKTLNVKADHPNGTVGRLTNISFTKENTIVEIVVLVDDLANKYNLRLPENNPNLEIESGQTFKGELVFQGGVT